MYPSADVTDKEWEELKALYVQAFVGMSSNVSKDDLALMDHNPEQFWTNVFDRDKTRSNEKNYTFSIAKDGERIVAYGLYTCVNDAQYLYIHHFVVHPNYQGQGLGKELMHTILELFVDVQKVGLLTRTYNVQAQNFYRRLGFSASVDVPSAIHEYYSNDRVYMERIIL
jgi:ribosomal protein S18 acetylase RimI-like enzyme